LRVRKKAGEQSQTHRFMRLSYRLVFEIVAPAILACGIAYYGYDAIAGATGHRMLRSLRVEAQATSAEIAALVAERRRLQQTAAQLSPRSLDPDIVDEKIRSVLGYVASDDIVVPRDQFEELIGEPPGP
jgi:cell division protein FtsB